MEQQVNAILRHNRASEVFWKGGSIPTNKETSMSFSDALRLSRLFLVDLYNLQRAAYNPNHWISERMFGFIGDADTTSGFGNCTTNILRQSLKNDFDVRWIGKCQNVSDLNYLLDKVIPNDVGMIWHEQPNDKWLKTPFEKNIALVPFETTRIPQSWVPKINSFNAALAISKQNIQMLRDSGVTVPIELIQWGIDEKLFYPILRENKDTFTFGTMGALSVRKGTDILVKAFQYAFPIQEFKDVRLICKTSFNVYPFNVKNDKRISVQMTPVDHSELINNFFKQLDVFVFPTRGEAWGLPNTEAMATGLSVITTGWSGPMEYMNENVGWLLDYKMVPAKEFSETLYHEYCGDWAEPNFDDLVAKMRHCYFHRDEVKQKGLNAAKHIQNNFLWKDSIKYFLGAIDKHLR